ncbi:hypothetical protein B0H11DRAFT_1947112 [Mycena galericulata]|nr:hypothetical protein B0H11DRAFT_2106226 [Mycena galericulata]KAJ7450958.1 hypothetical protein B0H11DRAFT_2076563 [Mycena galericulata]KAJ7512729.1 hypothetical protein B0H11DRAFT_1947112 [Mycena galericulata]
MKAPDIPSEGAIKLLAEFLDLDTPGPYEEVGRHRNAEYRYTHTCAPRTERDPFVYDSVVQYDALPIQRCLRTHLRSLWSGRTRMICKRMASVGHCYRPPPATCCFQHWWSLPLRPPSLVLASRVPAGGSSCSRRLIGSV